MKVLYIAVGIVLASTLSPSGNQTSSLPAQEITTPAVVFQPALSSSVDRTQQETGQQIDPLILWAVGRFASAGLGLPDLTFVVFDSTIDCGGSSGYYFASRKTLHICRLDNKTVLHELAHAWAGYVLTDEQKESFTEFRGADGWNNADDEWKDRATEQAAETIAWALADEERTVAWILEDGRTTRRLLTIDNSSPEQLAEAFGKLTGMDVPADHPALPDQPGFDISPELLRAGS